MTKITRRRLLQGSGALAAGLALGGCRLVTTDQAQSIDRQPAGGTLPTTGGAGGSRPNILLILADDLGFSDIGCFGSEIATPNLDRLASTGRRFSNLHNNPRCCPSRTSLLTGLYPTQAGVGFMTANEGSPQYQGYLNSSCVTIAEALGLTGYRSAIAGKWHVAPDSRLDDWPAARGFERSFCEMGGGDYYQPVIYEDGKRLGSIPVPADYYVTDDITDHAIDSIRTFAAGDDPFFMYLSYKNPHYPLQAPEAAVDEYRGHYDAGWDALRDDRWQRAKEQGVIDPAWRLPTPAAHTIRWDVIGQRGWQSRRMEVYAAQVALMDQGIGRVIDTLESLGLREDTIVLFMSDNGASAELIGAGSHLGQLTPDGLPMQVGNIPGLMPGPSNTFQSYGIEWANASNSPFRKWKRWVEEGGISTPLIASWPGTLPAGGVDNRFLHLVDLMPTFLELAGGDYPSTFGGNPITPLVGHSFAQVLADAPGSADWQRPGLCFWEHMGHRAARTERWKIVSDLPTGPFELFDMLADRTEVTDVSAQYPDITASLASAWQEWKVNTGVLTWHPRRGYRQA